MARSDGYARLCESVGRAALREHEPIEVDGLSAGWTLSPADGEELAHALAALARCGLAVIVHGGGSSLGVGNAPRRLDGFLSTQRLAAIDELDASEGVCRVRGGRFAQDGGSEGGRR